MKSKKNLLLVLSSLFVISLLVISFNTSLMTSNNTTITQNNHFPILSKNSSLNHEHINITNSNYEIVIGWVTEPPVVGVYNGILVEINMYTNNGANVTSVLGAENNLTVVIVNGGVQTQPAHLNPINSQPGSYDIPIIPSLVGTYTVKVTGQLGSAQVDETITMDSVSPASSVVFPNIDLNSAQDSSISALNNQINSLNSEISILVGVIIITLAAAVVSIVMSYLSMNKIKKS